MFLNMDDIELWWVAYYLDKKETIGQKRLWYNVSQL
jgi:hypothetical protein